MGPFGGSSFVVPGPTLRVAIDLRCTMLNVRLGKDRGHANHGWLDSHHSFSFAGYHDPAHMGFGPLRVINEDRVAGGQGFGAHGHADMEILSYVLSGQLAHQDSLGNGSTMGYGDVQRMSAGQGVKHSEFNASAADPVHFLQIWILPDRAGATPGYEQIHVPAQEKTGQWRLIASPDGQDGSVTINQQARVFAALVRPSDRLELALAEGRLGYVHVATGHARVNGHLLGAGAALKLVDESQIVVEDGEGELLAFDLPR